MESLGRELRDALPPLRLHSVSIYDTQGNVLWLSEGALGPDEHGLVVEALDRFASGEAKAPCEDRLEDGRLAVFLPVQPQRGPLGGLVMILADLKADNGVLNRITTSSVQTLVQRLAGVLRPAGPRAADPDPTSLVLSIAEEAPLSERSAVHAQPAAARELTPAAIDQILEDGELSLELEPPPAEAPTAPAPAAPAVSPPPSTSPAGAANTTFTTSVPVIRETGAPARAPAAAASPRAADPAVALEVLPFVKLRSGGRTRRFEVLPRGTPRQNRDPAALDVLAVERLLSWLAEHRDAWTQEPTSFTLNLSIATLEDERFLRHLTTGLGNSGISPDTVGFEIAEPLCTQRRAQVERFISGCDRLGCFVVIDGFSFDSTVIPLLRSKAVRLVKIDPRLTGGVLKDKLSQAMVVAIVQAVKVLGIHCAAQQVDSQLNLRWLTAVGCDFGQGTMLARPMPIERLEQETV